MSTRVLEIVAVEPDKGNFDLARLNTSGNTIVENAAISCENGSGKLIDCGRNNAFRVIKDQDARGEQALKFITVHDILECQDRVRPFLIKIDIEGFESDLFANDTEWIDDFPILLIELHDWMLPNAVPSKNFLKAISIRDREFMHFNAFAASIKTDVNDE